MCTWYYADHKALSYFISKAQRLPLANQMMNALARNIGMSGDIRPTDIAAVLAPNKQGKMAVFPMVWGFTHEAADKPIVNCRVESAAQKALWRDSWYRRRCVIPASWYYEWGVPPSEVSFRSVNEQRSIKKEKYVIQPEGSEITYLAGLYRFEEHRGVQIPVFAVLTREAAAPVSALHNRMPVMLDRKQLNEWIRPDGDPNSVIEKALTNMVVERAAERSAFLQPEKGIIP